MNWSNSGTIEAAGGVLYLGGDFTSAGIGTISSSGGGSIEFNGTLDNSGSSNPLSLATISSWVMDNGTIEGGTLTGSLSVSSGTLTLEGVTLSSGTTLNVSGGTLTLEGVTLSSGTTLDVSGGSVTLENSGIIGSVNEGAIDVTGGTLTLGGNWSNSGTLEDAGGILNLGGTFSTSDLGTLEYSSGQVELSGVMMINSANDTFTLSSSTTGSTLLLNDGTIADGTVMSSDGSQLTVGNDSNGTISSSSGTLNDVTLGSNLQMPGGTLSLEGTVTIGSGGGITGYGSIEGSSGATLDVANGGVINADVSGQGLYLGAGGYSSNNVNWSNSGTIEAAGGVLYLGGDFTSAGIGTISSSGGGSIEFNGTLDNSGSGSSNPLSLATISSWVMDNGTIEGGTLTGSLSVSSGTLTLEGVTLSSGTSLDVSGGTLTLEGVTLSSGTTLDVSGGSVTLDGNWSNSGTIEVAGGVLVLDGNFTSAGIGTISSSGGGSIEFNGTLDNSGSSNPLSLATISSWVMDNGTIEGGYIGTAGQAMTINGNGSSSASLYLKSVTLAGTVTFNNLMVFLPNGIAEQPGAIMTVLGNAELYFFTSTSDPAPLAILPTTSGAMSITNSNASGNPLQVVSSSAYQRSSSPTATVTINKGITISGAGYIADSNVPYMYNDGTISINGFMGLEPGYDDELSGYGIGIATASFYNYGTIEGHGQLYLAVPFSSGEMINAGTIAANGGNLDFNITGYGTVSATDLVPAPSPLPFINTGILTASNAGDLTVQSQSVTLQSGGSIIADSSSTVAVGQLGGAVNDQGAVFSNTGTVDINASEIAADGSSGTTVTFGSNVNLSSGVRITAGAGNTVVFDNTVHGATLYASPASGGAMVGNLDVGGTSTDPTVFDAVSLDSSLTLNSHSVLDINGGLNEGAGVQIAQGSDAQINMLAGVTGDQTALQPWNTVDANGVSVGVITAEINGFTTGASTATSGGVTFLDSTEPSAAMASVVVSNSGSITFQWVSADGATEQSTVVTGITAPVQLRLVRWGSTLSAYYSYATDDSGWIQIGTSQNVVFSNATILAGLTMSDPGGAATDGVLIGAQLLSSGIPSNLPQIAADVVVGTDENQQYTVNLSSSEPSAITGWSITWGDGVVTNSASGSTTTYTHDYADTKGSYTISITAQTASGPISVTVPVQVSYVAPVSTAFGPATVLEGQPYTLTLSPSTAAGDAISAWSVNWGDGTDGQPDIQIVSGTIGRVAHTFNPGVAAVVVTATVTDVNGSAADTIPVVVTPTAPTKLSVSLVTSASVALSWTGNSTIANAMVIVASTNDGPYSPLLTVAGDAISAVVDGLQSNQNYSFEVIAEAGTVASAPSNTVSTTTDVAVPAALNAIAVSKSEIDLTWIDSAGASGYAIDRSTDGVTWSTLASVAASTTSYQDSSVTGTGPYYYQIVAIGSAGNNSNPVATAPVYTLDGAALNPQATFVSGSEIDLTWSDPSNGTYGFNIQDSTNGGTSWANVIPTTLAAGSTSFAWVPASPFTPGTTYDLRVQILNGSGSYANSGTVSLTVPAIPAPVTGLTATTISSTQINLSWTDSTGGQTGFVLQRQDSGNVSWYTIATLAASAASFSDTTLAADTAYNYQIAASNANGDSAFVAITAPVTTPPAAPPAAPVNAEAYLASSTKIDLSWTAGSTDQTGFVLQRELAGSNSWSTIADLGSNTTNYNDTNLTSGTAYQYQIAADNAGGDSAFTAFVFPGGAITVTPGGGGGGGNTGGGNQSNNAAPLAPDGLQPTSADVSGIDLAWNNPANYTSVTMQFQTPGNSTWQTVSNGPTATATSYAFTPSSGGYGSQGYLTAGTYKFQLQGTNSKGASRWSSTLTVTVAAPAPISQNLSLIANNDGPQNIGTLLAGTTVPLLPPSACKLRLVATPNPKNGTLTQNVDGTYTYTADSGFVGIDTFTYQVQYTLNGNVATGNIASAAIQVSNQVPMLNPGTVEPVNLPSSSGNSNSSTYYVVEYDIGPAPGSPTPSGPSKWTYNADQGHVTLETDYQYQLNVNGSKYGNPNVEDAVVNVTLPASGSYASVPNVTASYYGNDGYENTPTVNVNLVGGQWVANTNTNSNNIIPQHPPCAASRNWTTSGRPATYSFVQNEFPAALGGSFSVSADSTLTVSAKNSPLAEGSEMNVPASQTPPTITFDQTIDKTPQHGTFTPNSDGSFTYTPNAGFVGTDFVTYTLTDGSNQSNYATIVFNVTPDHLVSIDSDNNDGSAVPENSVYEQSLITPDSGAKPILPGKLIQVNSTPDSNGAPGWAAYLRKSGDSDPTIPAGTNPNLVPIQITLPANFDANGGTLDIQYNASNPTDVQATPVQGVPNTFTYSITDSGDLRLWTSNSYKRSTTTLASMPSSGASGGYFVPSGMISASELEQLGFTKTTTSFGSYLSGTVTLWIERVALAGSGGDTITVTANSDTSGSVTQAALVNNPLQLVVDSANVSAGTPGTDSSGTANAALSASEQAIANNSNDPGKVVIVDGNADTSANGTAGVPTFADFTSSAITAALVPVQIVIPDGITAADGATLTFSYSGSDPSLMQTPATDNNAGYILPSVGNLRLWDANSNLQTGGVGAASNAGNYITPNFAISLSALASAKTGTDANGGTIYTFYLEAVKPSASMANQAVTVTLTLPGEPSGILSDISATALVTAVEATPPNYSGDSMLNETAGATAGNPALLAISGDVNLANGSATVTNTDISINGFNLPWGQTRTWSNQLPFDINPSNGNGWIVSQWPQLIQATNGIIAQIGSTTIFFDQTSPGVYKARYDAADTLTYDSANSQYILTDSVGDQIYFHDFTVANPQDLSQGMYERGGLIKYVAVGGGTVVVPNGSAGHDFLGNITSETYGSGAEEETIKFTYRPNGANGELLAKVQLLNNSGTVIQEADYTYYTKKSSAGYGQYGTLGDLESVIIEASSGNGLVQVGGAYYRYTSLSQQPVDSKGNPIPAPVFNTQQNLLTDVVTGTQFAILAQSLSGGNQSAGQPSDSELSGVSESQLQNTFDTVGFAYTNGQVTTQYIQGAGASTGQSGSTAVVPSAIGQLTYSYAAGSGAIGLNIWKSKAIVTDQNGNDASYYFNNAEEVMLQSFDDQSDPSNSALNGDVWNTYYNYNSSGQIDLTATPSALMGGFSESNPDLVNFGGDSSLGIKADATYQSGSSYLSTSGGLVTGTVYNAAGTTAVGFVQADYIQQGTGGALVEQDAYTYQAFAGSSGGATIYRLASSAAYQLLNSNGTANVSTAETTIYSYSAGTTGFQLSSMNETLPSVSNAPAASIITNYDPTFGFISSVTNANNMQSTYTYNDATGAVTQTVKSGDGVSITTSEVVDALGRPTQITDGNGNVTNISYIDGLTFSEITTTPPVGPTQVTYINYGLGFTDSYTLSGNTIESLTRTDVNAAGQTISVEKYFDVVGLTPGSQPGGIDSSPTPMGTPETPADQIGNNANYAAGDYYQTLYAYNQTGQQYQTTDALGTITQTNYDALGRPYTTEVGTSASNLTTVSWNIYDLNGVGNSNLTETISSPGGVPPSITSNYFNWRDQMAAQYKANNNNTAPSQLIVYTLDNLGEVTNTQIYNAADSNFNPTSDGAGTFTIGSLNSGALRAQTMTTYNARGEASSQEIYNNPSAATTYLQTTYQYDGAGNTTQTVGPNGLTTVDTYDGLNRRTSQTLESSGGTPIQSTATTYDGNSNVILTVTKNYNSNGGGAYQADYTADYYNAANQLLGSADYGTTSVSAPTPGSVPPARSSAVLVTTDTYDSSTGFLISSTDPNNIATTFANDALGRPTFINVGNGANVTGYVYNGLNDKVQVKSENPSDLSAPVQITTYIYGSSVSNGQGIVYSNDLLSTTELPDPNTGASVTPSNPLYATNHEQTQYNIAGQLISQTGQDDVTHVYTYNALGEQTADTVWGFPPPVNGVNPIDETVTQIATTYNTLGEATQIQSLTAAGGVESTVSQTFDGLGDLTSQTTSGLVQTGINSGQPVYTSVSNATTYSYTFTPASGTASGSNLLARMEYPDSYILTYGYTNAVDAALGRPTTITDSTGELASFTYLGSSTQELGQTDYQAGISLAASLNQFGQTSEQKWTGPSGTLADNQYAYDCNGNVLYASDLVNSTLGSAFTYDSLNQLISYQRGDVTVSGNTGSITNATLSQGLVWNPQGALILESVNGTTVLDNLANAQNQNTSNTYDSNGDASSSTNAAGSTVNTVFNAWGQVVSYSASQAANGINFKQTETIQYDALGRPLGEYESGTFPGEATAIQTQHTLSYNAMNGQVISDTNAITTSGTAPEGTDPARYVYAPDGTLLLREMGTFGATTPSTDMYALTDPTGTVIAIAGATGTVDERYVFDGLGNAQALQANGTPYGVATFSNPNRSANWEFQQQFSGSTFNTGTQLLTYAGTDYAWNIVYHGQMYNGIPGVYQTANGAFNPRQQSLLAPDLQAIQQGLGADGYNPGRGVLSYLWSEVSSAWNDIYESTPLYGAGQALTEIGNGISEFSSWANDEINSAPQWLQPVLAPYQVELGAFSSVGNVIGGMGSLLENPIGTAANVVMHPIDVAEAAWGGVTGTFSNLFSGNPYQMGQAIANIGMAVAPFAGEFGDVVRVGEVADEATPFQQIMANLQRMDFSAEYGTKVFYSGGERFPGGTESFLAARGYAAARGLSLITDTEGGAYLDSLELYNDATSPVSEVEADKLWEYASSRYASSVLSGEQVTAVTLNPTPTSMWLRIEFPILDRTGANIVENPPGIAPFQQTAGLEAQSLLGWGH